MALLGPIGILVAISLLMFLAYRGVSILVIGPVTAAIIMLTNQMALAPAIFTGATSYMGGLGSFITNYFLIFVLGAILGKYLEDSGAAVAIANSVLSVTGKNNPYAILLSVTAIGALLTYGGINVFIVIFTIIALSRPLFRALNIPWDLVLAPIALGCATFTMVMLPGSPSIQNVIPTTALGTTLTAAPLIGFVATIITIAFGLFYMKWQLNKAIAAGEGFVSNAADVQAAASERQLPGLLLSVTPMLVLVLIILVGSSMKIPNIIIPALIISILVAAVALNKYVPKHLATINSGALNAMGPAVFTAAAVGVGTVAATAPGFKAILGVLKGIPGGPIMEVVTLSGFMAIVTGSPSGALGIVMPAFGKAWLATGLAPEVIHRIAAISAAALGGMPHNGTVFALMGIAGLTHKQCYKHVFWVILVAGVLSLIGAVITALLFY